MKTLKQIIKNQECRTVTNDYLCDDCVIAVVKTWLEQKKQEVKMLPETDDEWMQLAKQNLLADLLMELDE